MESHTRSQGSGGPLHEGTRAGGSERVSLTSAGWSFQEIAVRLLQCVALCLSLVVAGAREEEEAGIVVIAGEAGVGRWQRQAASIRVHAGTRGETGAARIVGGLSYFCRLLAGGGLAGGRCL